MMLLTIALPLQSCSQSKKSTDMKTEGNKALVCFFSATGTTADAARRIAEIAHADIYEIEPAERYTPADLDWTDSLSRSYIEMHDRSFRPVLKDSIKDMTGYEVVFIGYPNWWNTHPTIINTFIENNNLQGKIIVPFMTSGGSDIINSEKQLKEQYPSLAFRKGMLINNLSDKEIEVQIKQLNLPL